MPSTSRASIILRCSPEHAVRIRHHAALDHRTVAGYLLFMLQRNLAIEERYFDVYTPLMVAHIREDRISRGPTTAMHLRCSVEEANRIRRAAARRQMSISKFIVFALERSWRAIERARPTLQD
jgi:uncharacterized protein (DUF1778 family)